MTKAVRTRRRAPARPWPVTALGLLLLLQAAALAATGAYNYFHRELILTSGDLIVQARHTVRGGLFILLALLAFAAAAGFFRVRHGAWRYAMLAQGLSLLMALIVYFLEKPAYGYFLMLYGIVMVIYLNHGDVVAAFRHRPSSLERGQEQ